MKNSIMQATHFLRRQFVDLLSYYFILRESDFLREILPLKSKLSGKFQRFNTIDGSIEMKNFKALYESQSVIYLQVIIHPPPVKSFPRLWNKNFQKEICRDIKETCFPSAPRMQILGVWCSANAFTDTNQNHVFGCIVGVYFL